MDLKMVKWEESSTEGINGKIMNDKILTVVVPTYNAENYLRDNLNSFYL